MDVQQPIEKVRVDELRELGVRFTGSEVRGNDWALVLASVGVVHKLERTLGGFQLLVRIEDIARASSALDAYDRENPPRPAPPPAVDEYGGTRVGIAAALSLIFAYALSRAAVGAHWEGAGAASSELILRGQWYRVVTALFLHGDGAHLVGNVVSAVLFLTLLGRRLGPGLALALVLCSGALGNAANALVHQTHHVSIGASTALFGCVGLLGAVQAVRGRRASRWPTWVPLAASLGLLAMLGASKETDMLAHLFGFLAGCGLGLAAAYALPRPPRPLVQMALLAGTATVVVGCWVRAIGG